MTTKIEDSMLITEQRIAALEAQLRIAALEAQLRPAPTRVNHLLHGLITLATAGFWLPVWAYLVYKAGK